MITIMMLIIVIVHVYIYIIHKPLWLYDVYFTHCFIPTLGGKHPIWHYLTFFLSKKPYQTWTNCRLVILPPKIPTKRRSLGEVIRHLGREEVAVKKSLRRVGWWWMMDIAILMILIVFNKWFMSWRSFFKKTFMTFQVLVDSEVEYNTDRFAWRVFMRTSPVLRWNLGQNTAAFGATSDLSFTRAVGWLRQHLSITGGGCPCGLVGLMDPVFFLNLVVGSFGRRCWYIHECWEDDLCEVNKWIDYCIFV